MNIKLIEALVYVHRHGTFKKAAEALYFESDGKEYVTPESIQYRMKQLGEELGVEIYVKKQGSSTVRITREGILFLKEALDVYQRMLEWREVFVDGPGGLLAFATTQAVLINRLHEVVAKYHELHPDVTIRAHNASSPDMERMVADGRVDFAISTRPPSDSDLEYVHWMQTDLVVVARKGHPLLKKPKVSLAELAQHPLVLLEPEPHGDREKLDQAFRQRGLRVPRAVFESSNSEILFNYVESGMGVTVTSSTNLLRNRREVGSVAFAEPMGKSEVGLLVRRGQFHPARARNFIRLLGPKFEEWIAQQDQRGDETSSEAPLPKAPSPKATRGKRPTGKANAKANAKA